MRVQERKHTLTGANAPLRVDPLQLAGEAGPLLSSTDQLRAVFDEWREEMAQKAERRRPMAAMSDDDLGADRPGVGAPGG